jgi:hypothetical protein
MPGTEPAGSVPRARRRRPVAAGSKEEPRAISRFIVMATLQAARAERLGLARASAYSFGLNRAIFFAAAKQGFKTGTPVGGEESKPRAEPAREAYQVGDDFAYRDPTAAPLSFTIGGTTQTEADFERQIVARFGSPANFARAWAEAQAIVAAASEAEVRGGPAFYQHVYRPRRDVLRARWTEMIGAKPAP